jgi:outer membrane immunogenic protein
MPKPLAELHRDAFAYVRLRKTLVLAAGVVSLLAGSALAADLPTRKGPPVAPVYVPPPFTWTGFYVGGNAGGAWRNNNNSTFSGFPFVGAIPVAGTSVPVVTSGNGGNRSGFVGGIQGGYNYQFGIGSGFVLGGEADIDYANVGRNNNNGGPFFGSFTLPQFPGTIFSPSNLAAASIRNSNNNQYFGTVRLRAGYAWDRFLFYATGGLAYGGVNANTNNNVIGAGVIATTATGFVIPNTGGAIATTPTQTVIGAATTRSGSTSKAGWTVGGGAEYAITNNWTVKLEYLYANFGHINSAPGLVFPGVASAFNNSNRSITYNVVRLGVNYKFW